MIQCIVILSAVHTTKRILAVVSALVDLALQSKTRIDVFTTSDKDLLGKPPYSLKL